MVFEQAGEKLIGLRLKTQSGAIHIKYHQVIVADYPKLISNLKITVKVKSPGF